MNATPAPAPRDYQLEGIEFLRSRGRALLADEPGLGKTLQLIRASEGRTLVVAPAMILDGHVWADEIARWADDPDRFTCVPYTRLNVRTKTTGSGTRPIGQLRPEVDRDWDTIIADESHYIKGRATSWTWALQELARRAPRVYLATGTPIPNWGHELFTTLQILFPDRAQRGAELGSYWRWAERWFDCRPNRFSNGAPVVGDLLACGPECADRPSTDPCRHYHEFAAASFGDRYLRRLRDTVATDLPPLTEQRIETPMLPTQKAAYRQMRKEMIAAYESDPAGRQVAVTWSTSARHVVLDRISTGLQVAFEDAKPASGKLDRLEYDLSNRSRPTLVFAHYRASLEAAAQVADRLNLHWGLVHGGTSRPDRSRIVRAFQSGELDVLFGSLETLAEGLTLTQADLLIMLEKSWKPSRNTQAIRRVHRLGQTRPVTVLDYVTPNTVDSAKRELLAAKTDHQVRALTAADLLRLI